MSSKKKQKKIGLISVILFTLTLVLFVWYEWGGGRTKLNYTDIIVLTEDVYQGTIVTASMIGTIKYEKENMNPSYLLEPSLIIGKEAKHYVPKGTPLVTRYFDNAEVVLNEGQVIAQIPTSWITSMPQTLRRNDRVFLYATDIPSDKKKAEQPVIIEAEDTTLEEPKPVNEMVQIFETSIAYVKDGSNREVYSLTPEGRKDASSAVASIEIITTPEDFKIIEKKVNEGSFLIVMYSDMVEAEQEKEKGE